MKRNGDDNGGEGLKGKSFWIYFVAAVLFAAVAGAAIYLLQPLYAQVAIIAIGGLTLLLPVLLKNPEFGIGAIAFFLPFERIPSFSLGGFSLRINVFLVVLVLLNYFFQKAYRRELYIPKDTIRVYVAILIGVIVVSILPAVNKTRALEVIASMILMLLVYLSVTLAIQDKKTLIIAIKGLLYGAIVASLFGLYQFLGDMAGLPNAATLLKAGYDKSTFGFARVQAFSYEPLYFANYIFIPLLVSVILLIRGQIEKVMNKTWAILLCLALLINFVLAISRGAYLAGGIVFVILLISQAAKVITIKNIIATGVLIIFVLGGSYLFLVKSEPRAIDEFVSHLLVQDRANGESVVSRLDASSEAWRMFQDNPVWGVGAGNFGPNIEIDPLEKPADGWKIVNNEYLEILAEEGAVGIAAFILLLTAVFWRAIVAFQRAKDEFLKAVILGLTLALVAILVQYATFSTLYIIQFWFLLGLIAAVSGIILNKKS